MPFQLRPGGAEYELFAAIQTAARGLPAAPSDWANRDGYGALCHRVIALGQEGAAVGFAEAYRYPNTAAGKFYVHVAVVPAARGQGVGTALLHEMEGYAADQRGNRFVGEVLDTDHAALAFVQKRGYVVGSHGFDSTLDLSAFDVSRFAGVIDGIAFFTLADRQDDATMRALYELYGRTMVDIPGYEATSFMAYATWQKFLLAGEGCRPDWVFIAADGDRLVGVTTMVVSGDHVYTNHTLVDREYRGRGIALALKLKTVAAAMQHGAPYMRTGNDSENQAILAVNRKLGYKPLAGDYTVTKRVGQTTP